MLSVETIKSSISGLGEHRLRPAVLLAWATLVVVIVWSYWTPIGKLAVRWWNDPDYLHCFLVPVFAGYLLWARKDMIGPPSQKGMWWGLPLIAVAAVVRVLSAYCYWQQIDPLSLIPCLAGIALLVGGWLALRWAWPAVVFLVFMIPVPGFLAEFLGHRLQAIGSTVGTYVIQTVGIPTVAYGNVIVLSKTELGVAEACNGLPCMMLFFAVSAGAALLLRRTLVEKIIIVLSAAPIAVAANVIRIAVTAVCYEIAGEELGSAMFHDLAGWFMMPLAVALFWLELAILDWILVEHRGRGPVFLDDKPKGGPRTVASRRV